MDSPALFPVGLPSMSDPEQNLIYHAMHRRPMKGCLPLFILLSCGVVLGILSLVEVAIPRAPRPKGEGKVYYRNDELLHFNIRQRTPLPLRLPDYVDPVRQEEAASQALPGAYVPRLVQAPPPRLFAAAPDSCVLDKNLLLALPPEGWEDRQELPSEGDGKEVQP